MKKISLFFVALLLMAAPNSFAGGGHTDAGNQEGIHWLTFAQAEQKMKQHPKKVIIDVYTSWCSWCKVMSKKTYTNPNVIKYVNNNFYAIKFNAEQKQPITFNGKVWKYNKSYRVNTLALKLLHGRLSYPTTVIMEEQFKAEQPIPGYLEVPVLESILKFFGNDVYLHESWKDYHKNFKSTWAVKTDKTVKK